jgi:hypothetical protein
LYFGVPPALGVAAGAALPCAVVAPPEEDVPAAAEAVPEPSAGATVPDCFVAVPCFVEEAVGAPCFLACDEVDFFGVLDVVPCAAWRRFAALVVFVAEPVVAAPVVFVVALVVFLVAAVLVGVAALLVLVVVFVAAGLVAAGLVAAGVLAAGAEVAVFVVVVLVAAGVVGVVLVVVVPDDPACCCATQVW